MSLNLDAYQAAMDAETDIPPREKDIIERLGLEIHCLQNERNGSEDGLWDGEIALCEAAMAEIINDRENMRHYILQINELKSERDQIHDCPRLCQDFCNEHQTQKRITELEQERDQIAAKERERCKQACREVSTKEYASGEVDHNEMAWSMACMIAIDNMKGE